ncbi:MAG TPA: hypothetical protein VER36_01915 [Flavisolibacter sp.]|nr:hypothetical protein [Flavisolibacter sp.]
MKLTDFCLNALLPLLLGGCVYLNSHWLQEMRLISGYAADGLWAYAFASAILIVWQRRIHGGWLATALLSAIIFEGLQHLDIVGGTADVNDLLVYAICFSTAVLLNNYFKHQFAT